MCRIYNILAFVNAHLNRGGNIQKQNSVGNLCACKEIPIYAEARASEMR